jgi:DNA modification methylase
MCVDQCEWSIVWGGNYFCLSPSRCWLVWDKGTGENSFADAELAWTNIDSVVRLLKHGWVGINARDGGEERGHPTQKPARLMFWCLERVPPASTVLDPFMGSGTTGVACAQLGKSFTGIERERKYFDIACERISLAQAQGQMFAPEQVKPEQAALL